MYRPIPGLPGRRWIERLLSKRARRAASRDFLFDTLPKGGTVIEVGVFDGDFSVASSPSTNQRYCTWSTRGSLAMMVRSTTAPPKT